MVKIAVPQSQIGHYEKLLFITNLFSGYWITGMIQALLPIYSRSKAKNDKNPILFNAFILIMLLSVISGVFAYSIKSLLMGADGFSALPFFNLVVVYLILSSPTLLIEYIYLLTGKLRSMVVYGLISYSLQVILVIAPLLVDTKIEYSVYGLIAISIIRMIWLLTLVVQNSAVKLDFSFLRAHIKQGIPLALKYLISTSGVYIDQIIITAYFSSSTFAIYRYGAREIPLVALMTAGLSNSMLAGFGESSQISTSLQELKNKSRSLMHLLFPISILAILLSKPLFPIIFSTEYSASANIFMIYALLVTSKAIFPQTVTVGLMHNGVALAASIVEMLLNIALSLMLLIPFGIEGVAMATVIVYMAEKILLSAYNRYRLNISLSKYTPVKTYAIYCSLAVTAYVAARFLY